MATTNARIQFSTDSLDTWTTINPTLREGEPVLAKTNDGKYALYAGNIGGSPFTESILIWDETKAEGIIASAETAAEEAGTYRDEVKASAKEAADSATKAEAAATHVTEGVTEAKKQAAAAKVSAESAAKSAETAEYQAEQAKRYSERSDAAAQADRAEAAAALATTQATNAAESATEAAAQATNAADSATEAATQAQNAAESAETATAKVEEAKTQAANAAKNAVDAANDAWEADMSAQNAAQSATDAANEAKKLTKALKYKGTVEKYADLPTEGNEIGDVWNIQKANKAAGIKAGDNVAWSGEEWDNLGGTCDLSEYVTKTELAAGISLDSTARIVWKAQTQHVGYITATEYGGNAATATKATQDGAGNVIAETYVKTSDIQSASIEDIDALFE